MNRMILWTLLLAAGGTASAGECEYRRSLDFDVDASGLETLQIVAEAGLLRVKGASSSNEVAVKATACASSERLLEGLQVKHTRDDSTLRIGTRTDEGGWSWRGNRYAYIDLEMNVPDRLSLDVEDSSGPIDLEGVAAVKIDDGSGAIRVRSVAGSVRVSDGSGGIDIEAVEGDVIIDEDGSGEIQLRGVVGDVEIDEDGSGEIDISQVGGNAIIRRDGSGSIRARGIAGDFEVGRDGSGGISYDDVQGRVELPDDRDRLK